VGCSANGRRRIRRRRRRKEEEEEEDDDDDDVDDCRPLPYDINLNYQHTFKKRW